METRFDLLLTDPKKALPLTLGVVLLPLASAVGGGIALGKYYSADAALIWGMAMLMVLIVLCLFWLPKKAANLPTVVTIAADGLTVLNAKSPQPQQVPFARIATYRFLQSRGVMGLHLKLTDGHRLSLGINSAINGAPLLAMAEAFEKAVRQYEQLGEQPGRKRDTGFFEYPSSTFALWFYATVIAAILWFSGIPDTSEAAFFVLCALSVGFVFFVVAWYGARQNRREF